MSELGRKDDQEKLKWHLMPMSVLNDVIKVLMFGANKYKPDNWKYVPDAKNRYYDATIRHINLWFYENETHDKESGIHHIAHAISNLIFLLWFELNGYDHKK